jgi:hypothetical protein
MKLENAVAIRIINYDTKHIIDEQPIEKVDVRKTDSDITYIYKLQKRDEYFICASGEILNTEFYVGFNIPKNNDIALEVIDENSNILFTKYLNNYYDEAGTLALDRMIRVNIELVL